MLRQKVTEADIIEVLLGDAETELEKHVLQAVEDNPKVAALYHSWKQTVAVVQEQTAPLKNHEDRVAQGVMTRLKEADFPLGCPITEPTSWWQRIGTFVYGDGEERSLTQVLILPVSIAAPVLMILTLFSLLYFKGPDSVTVGNIEGRVYVYTMGNKTVKRSLNNGDRLNFPIGISSEKNAGATLTFSDGNTVRLNEKSQLEILTQSRMNQVDGFAFYQVTKNNEKNPFTVQVPFGEIVDISTEFTINVIDRKDALVEVNKGKVEVYTKEERRRMLLSEGERIVLGKNGLRPTLAMALPISQKHTAGGIAGSTISQTPPVALPCNFQRKTFSTESQLTALIKPSIITMTTGPKPTVLRKAPPFTSRTPYMGVLSFAYKSHQVNMPVAMDKKLNKKWRIYIDSNQNGDLNDDPSFNQDEDYQLGVPFLAGTIDDEFAVYLRLTKTNSSYQLEFLNWNYLESDFPSEKTELSNHYFTIIDSNSNGAYQDQDGAMMVWTEDQASETLLEQIDAISPINLSTMLHGHRWRVLQNTRGGLILSGQKTHHLKDQSTFTPQTVKTIAGKDITITPSNSDWTIVYAWPLSLEQASPGLFNPSNIDHQSMKDSVSFYGFCMAENHTDAYLYLSQNNWLSTQIFQPLGEVDGPAQQVGLTQCPQAILLDRQGKVAATARTVDELIDVLIKLN